MQEYSHQKARVEARIGHKRKDGLLTRVAANIIMRAGYRKALGLVRLCLGRGDLTK